MKENEKEKLEKLTAEFEAHPMTQALRAEKAAETSANRKAAVARIEDLRLDLEATRIIQKDIDDLNFKLAVVDREREEIQANIAKKRHFLYKEKADVEADIRQAEKILFGTYDMAIDDAITFFRDRIESLMVKDINTQTRTGETNIFTEKKEVFVFSNYTAIRDALAYCRAAIPVLEKMKLTPEIDLPGIEALKAGIPDPDELRENANEKDMAAKEPGPGYLLAIKEATAEHLDYLISKATESAQKLLAPKRAGSRR